MEYRYHGTDIDGPTLNQEELYVRNRNLNDIIGNLTFTGAIYHLLMGKEATPSQEQLLDRYLASALSSLTEEDAAIEVIKTVVASGATYSQAIIAGLMVDKKKSFEQTIAEFDLDAIGLDRDSQLGLYYVGLIPSLMFIALESIQWIKENKEKFFDHQKTNGKRVLTKGKDYIESIFTLCTNRNFSNSTERKIFNDIMVSLHAGWGFLAPSVMLPRVATSTRVPIHQAIAAGFTAAGPSHVGACEKAMDFFTAIHKECSGDIEAVAIKILEDRLAKKEKIHGFGHPMFKVDSRNPRLRSIISEIDMQSDFIKIYDITAEFLKEKRGINPNIDSVSAAVFLSLGMRPPYGTGLFLCSRTSAMVAHILEQKDKPPFGGTSQEIRKWFGPFAVGVK
ncbi:citrate/2-methylcitrate synthase [Dapis sp. BLCC M126]|uniref:citrate/2-methylcitrate synthase n=1 Tax=Dapis sp. BLCC M126 TaxID=3400189 RepID=UPI003CF0E322